MLAQAPWSVMWSGCSANCLPVSSGIQTCLMILLRSHPAIHATQEASGDSVCPLGAPQGTEETGFQKLLQVLCVHVWDSYAACIFIAFVFTIDSWYQGPLLIHNSCPLKDSVWLMQYKDSEINCNLLYHICLGLNCTQIWMAFWHFELLDLDYRIPVVPPSGNLIVADKPLRGIGLVGFITDWYQQEAWPARTHQPSSNISQP